MTLKDHIVALPKTREELKDFCLITNRVTLLRLCDWIDQGLIDYKKKKELLEKKIDSIPPEELNPNPSLFFDVASTCGAIQCLNAVKEILSNELRLYDDVQCEEHEIQ